MDENGCREKTSSKKGPRKSEKNNSSEQLKVWRENTLSTSNIVS
jgi:hypothetical protein